MKTIYLNTLSGGSFEVLCQNILSECYGVDVENMPLVNDKGRDLIIHFPDGDTFVECKHHPNSTIGRPIVQKLHSAMVTEKVSKGMIITTGYFSKGAIDHILLHELNIALIDRDKLKEMAYGVGYKLLLSEADVQSGSMRYIVPEDSDKLHDHMSTYIERIVKSYPDPIRSKLSIKEKNSILLPYYRIEYEINAAFSTSVGTVHLENSAGVIWIMEKELQFCSDSFSNCFSDASFTDYDCVIEKTTVQEINSVATTNEITSKAYEFIIQKHTKQVTYSGRNNQRYTKVCKPSKKDILIRDTAHVYLPYSDVKILLHDKERNMSLIENHTSNFYALDNDFLNCSICNEKLSQGLLCNDCGVIVHVSKRNTHGVECYFCGKTLCLVCAKYFRKYLLFKKPVCDSCASDKNLNAKMYKITQ